MSHIDALMQKDLCRLFELFLTLSGKILTSAVLRDITLQFRMPVQIFVKAISHILPCGTIRTPSGTFFTMLFISKG